MHRPEPPAGGSGRPGLALPAALAAPAALAGAFTRSALMVRPLARHTTAAQDPAGSGYGRRAGLSTRGT
ncbi:hypothetical protein [Kocuria aegyptia]|uniref:Uncharacterized protein n=1 Tax=Kocuria aegyptia TaxID=330943 RepID=A0ABN2KY90_9MICC